MDCIVNALGGEESYEGTRLGKSIPETLKNSERHVYQTREPVDICDTLEASNQSYGALFLHSAWRKMDLGWCCRDVSLLGSMRHPGAIAEYSGFDAYVIVETSFGKVLICSWARDLSNA
ncbi:hypothetical protein LTR97_001667 [Elasticomyces elasticus]|uniref:Uncharacterized protein n=1 Tax=Elasticomyces elasticus TaxID=574655 RepID=A0AAN7WHY8_9PEZI|nr:hypothetical protein LTR97_001667 [Elasticomyces elasticus]